MAALWTFAAHEGVQPTNKHPERGPRGAVIYHKLSLGIQSEGGERRTERLLSASATCRLQHRPLFTYMSELLAAHARGDPAACRSGKPPNAYSFFILCSPPDGSR
jgi:transposase